MDINHLSSIDLSVASRVHLLEPGWNPKLEQQALDRVHRLGQTREVVTTCYFVAGPDSVEEVLPFPLFFPILKSFWVKNTNTRSKYIKRKQQWKLQLASSSFSDSAPPTQSRQIAAMLQVRSSFSAQTSSLSHEMVGPENQS